MNKNLRQLDADEFAKIALVGVFISFPISLALANLLMALTLFFWITSGNYNKRWISVREHPLTWPAIGMFALVIFGTIYSSAPTDSIINTVGKYTKFLFIPIALSLLIESKWRKRCILAFCFAMIITLISSYAGIWLEIPWSKTRYQNNWGADHTVFKDYIAQGIFLSTFILLLFALFLSEQRWGIKLLISLITALAMINILFMLNGRTGYFALFFGITFFVWKYNLKLSHKFIFIAAVLLGFLVVYSSSNIFETRINQGYTELLDTINKPINQDPNKITSINARVDMWRISVQHIVENPILGTGTGSYSTLAKRSFQSEEMLNVTGVHPHNQFLLFGVELGLLGMFGFIFYLYRASTCGRKMSQIDQARLYGFIGIMIVDSLFHGSLWLATENHHFTFMLALLCSQKEADSRF